MLPEYGNDLCARRAVVRPAKSPAPRRRGVPYAAAGLVLAVGIATAFTGERTSPPDGGATASVSRADQGIGAMRTTARFAQR